MLVLRTGFEIATLEVHLLTTVSPFGYVLIDKTVCGSGLDRAGARVEAAPLLKTLLPRMLEC